MPPTNRPPCPVCQATRFRKRDGVLYCERGHQIQGYVDVEGDEADVARTGGRRMYVRKGKRTTGATKSKLGVVYGTEGQYLAYEALQCIVAMQCVALAERFGLGDEFQTLCWDLWLLFVQTHRLQAANPTADPAPTLTASQASKSIHDMIYGAIDRSELQLSDVDEDDEDDEDDEEVEEDTNSRDASTKRRRAAIKYESGVDTGEQSELEPRVASKRKTTGKTLATDFISLPLSPCILYIACLHLRIPIMLADIHRLCASNEIPYLSAYDTLPRHLQYALMNPFHHALQPWYLPSTTRLRAITADLAHIFLTEYSLPTPPPPSSPLFLRLAVEWHLGPAFVHSALALLASLQTQLDPAHFLLWAHAQIPTRDPRPGDLRASLTDPELVLVAVAIKCAMLMLTPSSAPLAAAVRNRPGIASAGDVYNVSKHDPPVSFQGLVKWATTDAREFAAFARGNLPVFGAAPAMLPVSGPTTGSAPATGSGARKWADVANMLDRILKSVDPPAASTVAEELSEHHGVLFPLGIPQLQQDKSAANGSSAAVGHDWTDERWVQLVWTLGMSVARCSREELEPVLEHVVSLMRKAGGKIADPTNGV